MGSIDSDAPEGGGSPGACSSATPDSSSSRLFSGGKDSSPIVACPMKGGDMHSLEKVILHWKAETECLEKEAANLELIIGLKKGHAKLRARVLKLRKIAGIAEDGSDEMQCFSCGELGHFQRDCVQHEKIIRCWTCNEPGHFARECDSASMERAEILVRPP